MRAVFAIPGDPTRRTGGFLYEWSLLSALNAGGREVAHLRLPAGFPDPDAAETAEAARRLAEVPEGVPVILDGLVHGAIETPALARMRAPLVAMTHHPLALETGLSPARAALLRARETANLALAAHVLVPSPHTARLLVQEYGVPADRITVALPGFPRPETGRRPLDPPLILSVGILVPRKGHDVLLSALARIADLDWQARIVGAPYFPGTAEALRAQRDALGLSDRVVFTGELSEAELQSHYRQATLFALATRHEGYGMVFSEALLHGLPIVACATGAVPDTVPAQAGLLLPPDDAGAFAAALRELLEDPGKRARLAEAATRAGAALPQWADTAAVAGAVLDRLAR
ncbi:glycosyltransferase family 4 protein [Rhodobacter sp. CZR27]|uniref:glycosyltransferase family 4 protein n=1 Tax=Rhodobacter sp. CZR27 TaxID=2033869 RepID=UPI000BBE46DB|nr:glycosyltransferase family 4 protein [Rhodobacter sp. CZR27]